MLEGESKRQTDKLIEMKRERGRDREVERERSTKNKKEKREIETHRDKGIALTQEEIKRPN